MIRWTLQPRHDFFRPLSVHTHTHTHPLSSFTCACSVASILFDSLTPWTVARQAPLSIEFSRQESWSGLSCPPPGDLPYPGIEPVTPAGPALQADSLLLRHPSEKWLSSNKFIAYI